MKTMMNDEMLRQEIEDSCRDFTYMMLEEKSKTELWDLHLAMMKKKTKTIEQLSQEIEKLRKARFK